MRNLMILLLLALASAAVPPASCEAQQTQGARLRVPVWVAISPELQGTATPFRLARFAGDAPHDVILLAPDAGAAALTQAVEALLAVRRESGDVPAADATLRVRRPPGARVLPWAPRVLRDVRAAAPRRLPGAGNLRAVRIWLPTQRGGANGAGSGG